MTTNLGTFEDGPLNDAGFQLGQMIQLNVISYAYNDKVMAVGVETAVPSSNSVKHITLAVNRPAGGKPAQSNQLTNWAPTTPFQIQGQIQEQH